MVDHVKRRVHLSDWQPFLGLRDGLRRLRHWSNEKPHPVVLREVGRALDGRPDIVLLSAYLQHYNSVREIGRLAAARGTPVLLGGPMFNVAGVADAWCDLPGIAGVVGAEADLSVPDIVEAVCDRGDLTRFPGVTLPGGTRSEAARPLRNLDATPLPDFTDFPWDRYPVRIMPLMTGRGCQWDKCVFCSDVVSVSGRTFRTRSVDSVLLEMQEQARRHTTASFLFLDLKLNSYPDMIRGIAEGVGRYVQGAEWIGTVHVDQRRDNGLSRRDLQAAVAGGMRRVSFGLESGSQRLLDLMNKGSSVEGNSEFIRNAHEAGLSIRCTMFKGFPGETAEDMEATADFLETHSPYLDRVRFNDFSLLHDTPIFKAVMERGGAMDTLTVRTLHDRRARAEYRNPAMAGRGYRHAKARALAAVYGINRRPLRDAARQFDGLM
ncbi:B12-binding domain-containing radical SAM protein [Methylobacterium oryzihabitans]|uniref:Radical SAM protein n=1 Tax=Methylobacterium oryzihabitans TaxID=2499852 RepID=A0A3S2VTP9_9HYPH|nr:radical SAM protein [Methylobacterium oryzihabitans]RVU17185.1 radical SAM protein [Methylobacterium oryzihabitans]